MSSCYQGDCLFNLIQMIDMMLAWHYTHATGKAAAGCCRIKLRIAVAYHILSTKRVTFW